MTAKRGKGAKSKGSGFERRVAKQLTEWWQAVGLEGEFYKTPASGGLRWQQRDDTIGDICTPENFPFTIECKCREDWDYNEFFGPQIAFEGRENIAGWWRQACSEADRAEKLPWLIIKKNYHPALAIFPVFIWSRQARDVVITTIEKAADLEEMVWHDTVGILPFDEMLEVYDPRGVFQVAKERNVLC